MDLFFKIHKVFDLHFNTMIKSLMNFIGIFVFEMEDDKCAITATMQNCARLFLES